jgi:hypothetical protein
VKEIKIIQDDDGAISGEPGESEMVEESSTIETDENGVVSASKGKKLEDNIPVVDKKKLGTRPKATADWSDYSAM